MKYTLEEWRAEGYRRFGDDVEGWKHVCPKCGRVNTVREFKEAGATPDDSYSTCIGRYNGKGLDGFKCNEEMMPENGCNWAAFGLFGTLGRGDIVINDEGKEIQVFKFAEPETTKDEIVVTIREEQNT